MSQDNVGIPAIEVSLASAEILIEASKQGVVTLESGRMVSPTVYLQSLMTQPVPSFSDAARDWEGTGLAFGGGAAVAAALALTPLGPLALLAWGISTIAAHNYTHVRSCTIVIVNLLEKKLKLLDNGIYLDGGLQTGYPILSDGTQHPSTPITVNEIPGVRVAGHGTKTHVLCGVGAYQFQKNLTLAVAFQGTSGAIAFTSDDSQAAGKVIAVSWLVGESAVGNDGPIGCGVTSDLFGQYGSLKGFYDATAGKEKQDRSDLGSTRVWATFCPRLFDSSPDPVYNAGDAPKYGNLERRSQIQLKPAKGPASVGVTDLVLTVSVRR